MDLVLSEFDRPQARWWRVGEFLKHNTGKGGRERWSCLLGRHSTVLFASLHVRWWVVAFPQSDVVCMLPYNWGVLWRGGGWDGAALARP